MVPFLFGVNMPDRYYGASGGCIRLTDADVIDIYNRVPIGTRVRVDSTRVADNRSSINDYLLRNYQQAVQRGATPGSKILTIVGPLQSAYLYRVSNGNVSIEAIYPVSTGKAGFGTGPGQTPVGTYYIRSKSGDNAPIGTLFQAGNVTGRLTPTDDPRAGYGGSAHMTTRFFEIVGLENSNSIVPSQKPVRMHGTNRPDQMLSQIDRVENLHDLSDLGVVWTGIGNTIASVPSMFVSTAHAGILLPDSIRRTTPTNNRVPDGPPIPPTINTQPARSRPIVVRSTDVEPILVPTPAQVAALAAATSAREASQAAEAIALSNLNSIGTEFTLPRGYSEQFVLTPPPISTQDLRPTIASDIVIDDLDIVPLSPTSTSDLYVDVGIAGAFTEPAPMTEEELLRDPAAAREDIDNPYAPPSRPTSEDVTNLERTPANISNDPPMVSSDMTRAMREASTTADRNPLPTTSSNEKKAPPSQTQSTVQSFRGSTAKAKENYSYSGSDVSVFFVLNKTGKVVFANDIQTISVSTHPAKGVIRTLGRRAPVTYVEGSKTVAGTLVFSMLREDPFVELLVEYNNLVLRDPKESRPLDSLGRQSLAISADQLPPIDIMLLFHNEYDQVVSIAKVMNVHIIDNGMVSSNNDMYTEITYQYVAEEFMPPISRDYYDWIVNQRSSLPSNFPVTTPTARPDTRVQTSSTSSGEKVRSATGTISQIKIDSDGKIVVKLDNNSNEYTIYGIRTNVNMLAYQTTMNGIIGSVGAINMFINYSGYSAPVTVTEVPGTGNLEYMIQQGGWLLQPVWVNAGYVYPTQEAYQSVLYQLCNNAIGAQRGIWATSVNMPTPSWIRAR